MDNLKIDAMTKPELLAYAKENDIKVSSKLNKEALINAIVDTLQDIPKEEVKDEANEKVEEVESKPQKTTREKKEMPKEEGYDSLLEKGKTRVRPIHFNPQRFQNQPKVYRDGGSITIDAKDKFVKAQSDEEKVFATLKASKDKNTRTILSGKINGVTKRTLRGQNVYLATCKYEDFQILIPANFLLPNIENREPNEIREFLIKRLGSEIDFLIEDIDEEEKAALGNRIAAMEKKKKDFWFSKTKGKGNKLKDRINVGQTIEARVVTVVQKGAFVEVFGVEAFIPNSELSYSYIKYASEAVKIGDRIPVVVKNMQKDEETKTVITQVSYKRTKPNPIAKNFEQYHIGDIYEGVVTGINDKNPDERKFYVDLNSTSILCTMRPGIQRYPEKGDTVQVSITNKYEDELQIIGSIVHVSMR